MIKNLDRHLWNKMLEGSKPALESIYRENISSLYNYGCKFSTDPFLVEDCIQNLFVHIWEKRANLGQAENILAYLMLSLRRRIIKRTNLEKNKVSKISDHDFFLEVGSNTEQRLIEDESTSSLLEKLKVAMDQLSTNQKEILFLKFEQKMSNQEIADLMDINNQSVRNAIHRAISKLKELMLLFFLI